MVMTPSYPCCQTHATSARAPTTGEKIIKNLLCQEKVVSLHFHQIFVNYEKVLHKENFEIGSLPDDGVICSGLQQGKRGDPADGD